MNTLKKYVLGYKSLNIAHNITSAETNIPALRRVRQRKQKTRGTPKPLQQRQVFEWSTASSIIYVSTHKALYTLVSSGILRIIVFIYLAISMMNTKL